MEFVSIEELPNELIGAVVEFLPRAQEMSFDTKEGATDSCHEASDMFIHVLMEFGLCGAIEHYSFDVDQWGWDEVDLDINRYPLKLNEYVRCHWAVRSMGFIIDWTARQFEPFAAFPAIWRIGDDDRLSTRIACLEQDETADGDCGIHCLCSMDSPQESASAEA